ncbi:MAG: DUF979 domain-containing protein [Bacilli bacterium]
MGNKILEIMYIAIGLVILFNAIKSFKNKESDARVVTGVFWAILAFTFIFPNLGIFWGKETLFIPDYVIGYLVVIMALLSLSKKVINNKYSTASAEYISSRAKKIGSIIFIPAISIGILSFVIYEIQERLVWELGSIGSLGLAILISTILGLIITKDKPKTALNEGVRLLDVVGPMSILPQVLAALGAIFTLSGVGVYISDTLGLVIPAGNALIGVIVYCISMALFTIIMGNGFAAFSVITTGIGVPFVIMVGGNPVIVGALGLTAGYCGTLITPMAANFNIVPTSILEMEDRKWGIIKYQVPIAVIMLLLHIVLMYLLAF